jgi:hypothetical protein
MSNPNPLNQIKPGQVLNPTGRPKKDFSLTEGMRAFLSEHDPIKKQQRKDLLVEQTYKQAMRGDIAAIKMIFNYLEGMPKGSDTNIAVAVQNITYSPEDRLEVAYRLVAEDKGISVEELRSK